MANEDPWEFPMLLYRFIENEHMFKDKWKCKFGAYPWEIRAELKRFQAVLNAFTNGKYRIQSNKGRQEIWRGFMHGFGRENNLCTDEQLEQLKELFPCWNNIFVDWEKEKPRVGTLYELVFAMLYHGFKYITSFSDYPQGSVALKIVETYKRKEIDQYVDDRDDTFLKAILILLGPDFERSIGKSELITNWGYPKVLN